MRANPTPYAASWPGFGLADVRPLEGTYGPNEYQSLPAVPLDWLVRFEDWFERSPPAVADSPVLEFEDEDDRYSSTRAIEEEELQTAMPRLAAARTEFGVHLPDRFVRFIGDNRHPSLFHSVTDCYFNLPDASNRRPNVRKPACSAFIPISTACTGICI